MHTLVIEAVVASAKHSFVHLTIIESCIVLARDEPYILDL